LATNSPSHTAAVTGAVPHITRVVVLGAGTMGAAIAAHCANVGLTVTLLDIAPDTLAPEEAAKGLTLESRAVRDRIARAGFTRMQKASPAALATPAVGERITVGNFTDDFSAVTTADWVVEAIIEQLAPKREILARVATMRKPGSIVSSNTSGIPLHEIADGLPADFRARFLGTHFFNPPRYMKLLEIIPTGDTDPAVVAAMTAFATRTLGKGVVVCKDTPNFIANRIGTYSGMTGMRYAFDNGYTIEEVDALTGPLIGRPKTASFRLADLAGIDISKNVADNLYAAVPDDESREEYRPPAAIERMVAAGKLGNKTGGGFYQRVDGPRGARAFHVLDLETMTYRPPTEPDLPLIAEASAIRDPAARLRFILERADAGDRAARLIEARIVPTFAYAARRVPEITDDPAAIDDAMRWGYGQDAGPFETWDMLGVAETVARMERGGIAVAPWVREMLAAGNETFYRRDTHGTAVYSPLTHRYEPRPADPDHLDLAALKAQGKEVEGNKDASIIDLEDGVLCFEIHTRANAVGQLVSGLMHDALDRLEGDERWRAMVIGNDGEYFSAGANLFELTRLAPDEIMETLAAGHKMVQRIRFCTKPVVAAPFGNTLGLGAELSLASAGICAASETYMGLVEAGVGLIPGGGGCKEFVRRVISPPLRTPGANPLPDLQRILQTLAQAKVSTSALDARDLGFLAPSDRIVAGRDRLIAEAKRMALDLADAGYEPPTSGNNCYAAGCNALASLHIAIYQYEQGNFVSPYDAVVTRELANILCGGDLSEPQWVSEDYFLALERDAFGRLLQNPKTQERIAHTLKTGKPLRN